MTSGPAAVRWRRLVRARLTEMERLLPEGSATRTSFWDARARRFVARSPGPARRDPFVARVRRVVGRQSTVVDVGCGPGRFALALASRVSEVVAVDPSAAMLRALRRQSRSLGLGNIRPLQGRWQEVDVPKVDVGICSYVLPIVEDAAPFLRKLDRTCRQRAFLYLAAMSTDAIFDPFWRHFHGTARRPGPTYLDAVAVLGELGIDPDVEVVEVPTQARFRSLRAAVSDYRDNLLLPDTAEVRAELRHLLQSWLTERDGSLRPPIRTMPGAIISWHPRASGVDAGRAPA